MSPVRAEEGTGERIREGYEGIVGAGAMLVVAMVLMGAAKVILG